MNRLTQTGHSHLRRLVLLRFIAITTQCATLALAHRFLAMELPWLPMLITIASLAALNLFTWLRLRNSRPVTDAELFVQLCADVLALSILLYYGGGSTNPFISLFLLPLVIAAATLPHRYTWAMTLVTTACYTLLMKFYLPLPAAGSPQHQEHLHHAMPADDAFNMHVFGMWLGFVISAVMVSYFVVKMAYTVRERDSMLAKAREETLRNERIVALGIQAAGAAHELGTPLSTMAVVIGELQHDAAAQPAWKDALLILNEQVRGCKRILDKILANAQDSDRTAQQPADRLIMEVLDEWQLLRPTAQYRLHYSSTLPAPDIDADTTLRAALMNLLNNAADAAPQAIDIDVGWDGNRVTLAIHDHGHGLNDEVAHKAGSAFFTTKREGRGLGLFLANASIERIGGSVRLFNGAHGGATTELTLPATPAKP
ncbi:MAG: HAMP domain-containing histidine kinase [Nitrosomonadales bacterium]|nr:HAMP domain-containing histidine kinase [Nitrosomonadales bacterium]